MKSMLYTGTGDNGTTSLVGGERIGKASQRLEAYGTVDELSSQLGVVAAAAGVPDELRGQLREVQNELFNIGGYLATSVSPGSEPACGSLADNSRIEELEGWIDAIDGATPKIRAFVLPGGHPAAAAAHVARTVCRRAERRIISLSGSEWVDPVVVRYLNRLSDYLFAAARYLNFINGVEEIVWRQSGRQ